MAEPSENINDSFFNGIYQKVWKQLVPPGITKKEADFIVDVAQLKPGQLVLDVMCGYGRHALELSRCGMLVTAVDNLPAYIAEIRQKAAEENLSVSAILSGALQMSLQGRYDAAICMGNSFAFFNRKDAGVLLQKIAKHLNTGGVLMINSWMIAEIAIRHFKEVQEYALPDYQYELQYQFAFHPNRIISRQTITGKNGQTETINGVDYIYSLDELQTMFAEAGLSTIAVYSNPSKKPFAIGDGSAYIIAKKQ